jgi:hypothetical protein
MSAMGTESHQHRYSAGLQLDEDLPFQRRMWRLERMSWALMGAIVVAAFAGLFGGGPVSQATLTLYDPSHPAQPPTLRYERFARAHSESRFVLTQITPPDGTSVTIWLSDDYLSAVDVGHITPEPLYEELGSSGVLYHFRPQGGPHTIIFRFRPHRAGSVTGSLRLNGGPVTSFHQLLYP